MPSAWRVSDNTIAIRVKQVATITSDGRKPSKVKRITSFKPEYTSEFVTSPELEVFIVTDGISDSAAAVE